MDRSKKLLEKRIDKFLDHLEFLGYELFKEENEENDIYHASHSSKPELLVSMYMDVVIFHSTLAVKEAFTKDRNTMQSFVNELNDSSKFIFAGLTDNNHLFFFSYYFGPYGKKEFGRFVEIFNDDYISTINTDEDWVKYFEIEKD